jgi:hypothetical protein
MQKLKISRKRRNLSEKELKWQGHNFRSTASTTAADRATAY